MHYYQQNIGAYRRDTIGLSLLEHGIYRMLLDTYYLEEKPLDLDTSEIMRSHAIRIEVEQEALKYILKKFFFHTKEGYRHKRCDEEIAAFYAKSEKAKASANARWHKENPMESTSQNANASETHGSSNASGMLPQYLNTSLPQGSNKAQRLRNSSVVEKSTSRATRLPADWVLMKSWAEWALAEKPLWDAEHVRKVASTFRDHWIAASGKNATKLDWEATWRNWVRKEADVPRSQSGSSQYMTAQQQRDKNNRKSSDEFVNGKDEGGVLDGMARTVK